MALTNIQTIRLLVQDNSVGFYFLSDDEITHLLDRNSGNINRTAIEAAGIILLQLSLRSNTETVDIFSITGHRAAEQYRLALEKFVKSPNMNPILSGVNPYAGGISLQEMQQNVDNSDNNIVKTPLEPDTSYTFATIKGNYA